MDKPNLYWWTIQIIKPILAIGAALSLTRFLLPIKKGWRQDDQKLITKGMILLLLGLSFIALFIYFMKVG